MATKSPLQKLQHTVVGTVKAAITHPVGTAGKAVEQARGTVSLGRAVAGQVGKTAVGAVTSRLGHGGPATPAEVPESPASLRSVPETPVTKAPPVKKPAATKAPAKKAPPKKAPAKKPTTPTRPPVTDVATELVKEQAAHQPVQEAPPAPESPIDAAAASVEVEATPADIAKKAPAKKAPAKKAATKSAAKKAPAKKAAKKSAPTPSTPSAKLPARKSASAPKTAAELIEDADLPSPIDSIGSSTAPDAEQR